MRNLIAKWPWTGKVNPEIYESRSCWPKISIVTPSYNQGQFIKETILSVLNQNYPNLEYIIIDGGSTDNTIEIIKAYEDRITYWVSEKDAGQSDAIKKGLSLATGDIVSWINSDDIYLKYAFKKISLFIMKHPDLDFLYGHRIYINSKSEITGWSKTPAFDPLKPGYNIPQETMFWRKSFMDKVGFPDPALQFAMDFEYFLRFHKYGKGKKIESFLGAFRNYSNNKSSTIMDVGLQEASIIWKKYYPELPDNYLKQYKSSNSSLILTLLSHFPSWGWQYLIYRLKYKCALLRF